MGLSTCWPLRYISPEKRRTRRIQKVSPDDVTAASDPKMSMISPSLGVIATISGTQKATNFLSTDGPGSEDPLPSTQGADRKTGVPGKKVSWSERKTVSASSADVQFLLATR